MIPAYMNPILIPPSFVLSQSNSHLSIKGKTKEVAYLKKHKNQPKNILKENSKNLKNFEILKENLKNFKILKEN